MKRILVPTDFSPQAENALKVAAQLAKRYGGEIFFVHMLDLPMNLVGAVASGSAIGASANTNLPETLFFMKLAKQRFEELLTSPYLKGIKVHDAVEFHQAFNGIMEISAEHDCDIIVMGSHGATGFKEMFIGSNTEKVVRNSTIPVLVIKKEIPTFQIHNFVFATDCDEEHKHTLGKARDFAKKIGAKLHLLYVNTPNDFMTTKDAKKCIEDFAADEKLADFTQNVYNDVSVEKGILNFAESIDAELVGISTHGRKGIAHFFNGSISEDLVNHATRPVITFKI